MEGVETIINPGIKANIHESKQGVIWMEIYVGNIPKGTRPGELKKLIKESVKQKVFPRLFDKIVASGHLDKGVGVKILKARSGNGPYRYGHIVIQSQGLGQLAMDVLLNAQLRGKDLSAREYFKRNRDNDRRTPYWRDISWDQTCRRVSERRKKS